MNFNSPEFIQLYNRDQRIDIISPDARREVAGAVVRHISSLSQSGSFVLYSDLDEMTADAEIERQIAFFESIGHSFEWKVFSFDTPPDLRERLAARGFSIGDEEAILVLDMATAPAELFRPPQHTVKKIVTYAELEDVFAVERQVWAHKTDRTSEFLHAALTDFPDEMSIYVAYVDDIPAAAGWISFGENSLFAGLWGGSTVPEYRRRGVYTALLSVRAQEAWARGRKFLTVDASPMSRPILEKFGFQRIGSTWPCEWRVNSRET